MIERHLSLDFTDIGIFFRTLLKINDNIISAGCQTLFSIKCVILPISCAHAGKTVMCRHWPHTSSFQRV